MSSAKKPYSVQPQVKAHEWTDTEGTSWHGSEPPSARLRPIAVGQSNTARRTRWVPIWLWLLLPLVALALGGWWVYQSLIASQLRFETKTEIISGAAVVDAVKQVNKQIFIEHYQVVDVDYREAPKNWLSYLGIEQSFVVLLRGRVPAGIDLSKVKPEHVWISNDGKQAQLTLPPPEVFAENVSIDFARSRILAMQDTCPDLICENNVTAYQNQLLPEGKALLIDTAEENGILSQAAADAKLYYEQLLRTLGFEQVQVVVTGY